MADTVGVKSRFEKYIFSGVLQLSELPICRERAQTTIYCLE